MSEVNHDARASYLTSLRNLCRWRAEHDMSHSLEKEVTWWRLSNAGLRALRAELASMGASEMAELVERQVADA